MTVTDVRNKMKTLSQGQYSDSVLEKMASTFKSLTKHADFSGGPPQIEEVIEEIEPTGQSRTDPEQASLGVKGLVYNINIHLPESRDQGVYDALFRSLREHLF